MGEDFKSIQFSTGIGLKSARYIIEEEHRGTMTVNQNVEQKVYIVKVSFPKSAKKIKEKEAGYDYPRQTKVQGVIS